LFVCFLEPTVRKLNDNRLIREVASWLADVLRHIELWCEGDTSSNLVCDISSPHNFLFSLYFKEERGKKKKRQGIILVFSTTFVVRGVILYLKQIFRPKFKIDVFELHIKFLIICITDKLRNSVVHHIYHILSYINNKPFGIYGMDHPRKIGEGHIFLFFVEGRVIQFFLV